MTRIEFMEKISEFTKERYSIQQSKGEAYSGKEDALDNFKRNAKNLAISPLVVWNIYFSKHIDAINAYIRGEYTDTEPIKGRFMDAINYLELGYGLILDGCDKKE